MLKAFRRVSFGHLIGGVLLTLIGVALAVVFVRFSYKDFTIWFIGREVTGTVERTYYELVGEDAGVQTYDFFVDYSFEANNGETYVGSTELSVSEYGMFNEGGEVLVVYSPLNPTNNRIDDSRFVPLLFCSYLPVLLIIWLTLMYGWRLIAGEVRKPEPIPRLDMLQANKE